MECQWCVNSTAWKCGHAIFKCVTYEPISESYYNVVTSKSAEFVTRILLNVD